MEMQKQVKHPLWAEFWREWEKSWGDSEGVPLDAWPLAWWGYMRGHKDQQVAHLVLADFMARSNRPSLKPNQN